MGVNTTQATYLVIGGGFIGYWLFVLIFPEEALAENMTTAGWVLWGVLGFAIAAGLFAGRLTDGTIRNLLWIGTGIASGLAIAAAFYEQTADIIATFITGAGAGLIAAGLFYEQIPMLNFRTDRGPAPSRPDTPGPASGQWITPQQQQGAGSQQQGVTVVRQPYR